jgi:hypothetical protein
MDPVGVLSRLRCDRRLRALRVAVAGMLLAASWSPPQAATGPQLEQAVKASFLFKFAPFVEWPDGALTRGRPFSICLTGEDPFGPLLDEIVRGQRISGRTVQVRRLTEGMSAAGCQMLFAGRSANADYAPFTNIAGEPVLTVSDQKSGVAGAMIQFVMQGGRVRFQIDNGAARANGLVISSKLLGLAISVERK